MFVYFLRVFVHFCLLTRKKRIVFHSTFFFATGPSRNPFLNFRRTTFKYLNRPVPWVRRALAFADQSYRLVVADG